jgi:hypothetical protein
MAPTPEDEAQAIIVRAEETIEALCTSERRWSMSIPARPDHDPDLIFDALVGLAKEQLTALASLRAENDALSGNRDAWQEFAMHVAHCRECGEMMFWSCDEGDRLYTVANGSPHPSSERGARDR